MPPKKLSDELLVERIINSNNYTLFSEIFDRYHLLVYSKCMGFAKNEEEAKDLAQDVFVIVYTKLKGFLGKSKFSTWVYAITYNHCVNHVNRDKEFKISQYAVSLDEYDVVQSASEDNILMKVNIEKLKNALEIISPEDKMILLLKYQDDSTVNDIASVLEIGESAVKMRLKRAREKVMKICNEN